MITELTLVAAGIVAFSAIAGVVVKDDLRRERTATDEMWDRSIADYKVAAQERAAATPRPEPVACSGRIRKPLPWLRVMTEHAQAQEEKTKAAGL